MNWTTIVTAAAPHLRSYNMLRYDETAMQLASKVACQRDRWERMSVPPFPNCIIEFDAGNSDLDIREGGYRARRAQGGVLVISTPHGEGHHMIYSLLVSEDKMVVPSPWVIGNIPIDITTDPGIIDEKRNERLELLRKNAESYAWSTSDDGIYKPEGWHANANPQFLDWANKQNPNVHLFDFLLTSMSSARGGPVLWLAMIALLNVERSTVIVPPTYRDGRTIVGKENVPRYRPTVVVIRPDAPRRVSKGAKHAQPTGIKKREHDVHAHLRRYRNPDGSIRRTVKVRSHTRGDPELGRVVKQYLVEADPNAALQDTKEN